MSARRQRDVEFAEERKSVTVKAPSIGSRLCADPNPTYRVVKVLNWEIA
jgi:hypothetical protein